MQLGSNIRTWQKKFEWGKNFYKIPDRWKTSTRKDGVVVSLVNDVVVIVRIA